MSDKYKIITADKSDAEEILCLQYAAYQSEAAIYSLCTIPPLTQTLEQITAEFRESTVLKAVLDNGMIIGSVRAVENDDGLYIGKLMVLPDYQNKGLGKRLLHAIEDRFRGKRYWLMTGDKSEKNLKLYEKCGYTRFKTEEAAPGLVFVYLEKNMINHKYTMRRKDREVTDITGIEEIMRQCKTCHVAMVDGDVPYVVPLSYGYKILDGDVLALYFHSAHEGRKIDILKRGGKVCFEMSAEGEAVHSETPCNSGYYFSSVIGFGETVFIEDVGEKRDALSVMFRHQTGKDVSFNAEQAETVCVFKIVSADFTGKKKPRPMPASMEG